MSSLRKARKRVAHWERYYQRTVKPLVGADARTTAAEWNAWARSGRARIRNLLRRQARESGVMAANRP